MIIFNLPDLGEGLPNAEIHEWFVQEGDVVTADQPLVSMETAKALVDVPCHQDGVIAKLFGKPGDVIKTGEPLVGFVGEENVKADKGTVVGHLEESHGFSEDRFTIGSSHIRSRRSKATPVIRALAKRLQVNLDNIIGTGDYGMITQEDVNRAAATYENNAKTAADIPSTMILPEGFKVLHGVRRTMHDSMIGSRRNVVSASIFDEADIHGWTEDNDITVRLIWAIYHACQKEPTLNAWFDPQLCARKCFDVLHLGLAMDTDEGLFVPVIHDVGNYSFEKLRDTIDNYKYIVRERTIPAEKLKGATIILSNFGKFAGRFATPIIVPPMVAILAVGRLYEAPIVHNGNIESHRLLPLSLSFDHRAVTGGEATRFLGAIIKSLRSPVNT